MSRLRGIEELHDDIKRMREFMSEYKVVKLEQFDKYLYSKEPRIKKAIRTQMVLRDAMFIKDGMCTVKADWQHYYDSGLIKALWVMLDFCNESEYDSSAEYPAKLKFAKNGEVFEVCVAEKGNENILNTYYNNYLDEPSNFLVVVEDKSQMSELTFDGIVAFCIVSEDGEVEYYRNEGKR